MPTLYLPQMTAKKPKGPSVPIFVTRQDILKAKKSIIVIINERMQDLGVWAWRSVCTDGFDIGSSVGTVKNVKLRYHGSEVEPGVVVLNPGQYFYSYTKKQAMSHESWEALPRKSLFHPTIRADEGNLVTGSRTPEEHIATVFDKVVVNTEYVDENADLYVIAVGSMGNTFLKYMDKNLAKLGSRIKAAVFTQPHLEAARMSSELIRFVETRGRAWILSSAPLGTCIGMPNLGSKPAPREPDAPTEWQEPEQARWEEDTLCPTFSGEEEEYTECILPKVQKAMIDFFQEVRRGGKEYANPTFEVVMPEIVYEEEEQAGHGAIEGDADAGTVLKVKDVNKQGDVLPPSTASVEKVTDQVKKVQLADDEVEVAGIPIAKDLLAKAGLD